MDRSRRSGKLNSKCAKCVKENSKTFRDRSSKKIRKSNNFKTVFKPWFIMRIPVLELLQEITGLAHLVGPSVMPKLNPSKRNTIRLQKLKSTSRIPANTTSLMKQTVWITSKICALQRNYLLFLNREGISFNLINLFTLILNLSLLLVTEDIAELPQTTPPTQSRQSPLTK